MNAIEIDATQFERIAKALSDRRRFEILQIVATQTESCCSEIGHRVPVAQPTISHHLKELTNAGLLASRREGQHCYYQFRRDVFTAYLEQLRLSFS
ncbi:helix-turn-helix transcriptional regulator [Oscillatoriales cyanobacterium LEGE 11467]|uniref:Helix-turn-helix transcriptional regulator n=1 Tax=Zarconia navalis LEGE 11467 TaxID=1828826 RepID=A0A928Z8A2_9CYAN|nr:metalloregulator ArsR/SmtB family transcription factor [Zarconia navalis]MBE9040463.1 helix-turn-helix transcriptional regulator [Zarconia navalis LEGE 11467]